jgi:glycosyltransferase involved in cell wall biosynthesis
MDEFKVSVIIPVYNAEKFVVHAVESAVALEEVGEIILVEDSSPDNALQKCKEMVSKYKKVQLYQHPESKNMGPGASRNLGIKHASFDYIAFLDADDWYLPNRFKRERKIFMSDPKVDGVYNATGFYFEDIEHLDLVKLTTFRERVPSSQLAISLLKGNKGSFTTDAITLRRSLIDKVGGFHEKLWLHQDTHMWVRCAVCGTIIPGELESPVAIRRVHKNNRISTRNAQSHALYYRSLFNSLKQMGKIDKEVFNMAFKVYIGTKSANVFMRYLLALVELLKSPRLLSKLF